MDPADSQRRRHCLANAGLSPCIAKSERRQDPQEICTRPVAVPVLRGHPPLQPQNARGGVGRIAEQAQPRGPIDLSLARQARHSS